ncbi:LOW QUALITY PROTEIN: MAM domain-containing glycosylphosphatidylinositol anchor protein 2 [Takifugu rubripes]|uniref:LOW QUALITY PROTEIN: MAM domain-containing glycosylphosphatidylinositol anchor protein 2 n=1 Tax=Takifugu rubripes TaxID=31033 RepID=UPI001145BC16|nr:LOW QUALITY PROTEIN: MAM domain-containing glycosylphosphatidylinositol anchor protein 2-like [Takifugu rubripes]
MDVALLLLWLFTGSLQSVHGQGVYAPPTVRIIHPRQPCNLQEERYTERVFTIREGATLELQCLVTGHPRPQVRWTKTVGGASERQVGPPLHNETLKIGNISRHQGGRYYCKADNGLGSPAIHSIRVDVYYLDDPVIWVHQSVGEMKEQFYSERTVFLRCASNGNPPVRYTWRRGREVLSQGSDAGVEIYEPFFTQGETKILKLKNLRPQDYAEYTCISSVRNICGIGDKSAHFSLTNLTAPPSIKLLLEDPMVVNPGETITLVCVASGGDPRPTLTWVRPGGEDLPRRSVVNGGTLTIPAVTVEEGGAYTCLASNHVGSPVKKSVSVLVRGLRKGRFWITPDPYHNDDNIQIGREVKISCQVEATPPEELQFIWLKNGRPLRSSERMVITHTDTNVSPGTTNLDIIDLKFTDFGTYTCVASLANGGSPEISIDVNISSTTVPPELTVPRGRSHLIAQEGDTVDLQCLVSGKPKPIILWSRVEESSAVAAVAPLTMPDGSAEMESYDGVLRISNVTRDMSGTYRCQTSQYNGFNVKPREALIHLVVQFPPVVEPTFTEVRQALGRAFSLTCRLLQAHPARLLRYEWKLGSRLLTVGQFSHQRDDTTYLVKALNREGYGEYTCDITNEVGAGRCTYLVTGKAYAPEFYYDARSALWQNRPRAYGFKLQWTQMEPGAVDRILAYRLGFRQMGQSHWWEQQIPIEGSIQKGELLTYNLTELIKPESYLVRLTPITRFGEGDTTERIISYSTPVNPHLKEFQCGFEEEAICLFSQDKADEFDWTRHSAATRNTKYTPNTGPSSDHNGSKQGYYMYIETSRPRQDGDKARLLTPTFNSNAKSSASLSNSPTYCFSFYYHMYGKHIGALNVFLRQKGPTVTDTSVWSLSGNQGDQWLQAKVNIQPTTAFQMLIEGVRGAGIEGDIAIDDVAIQEGECTHPPSNSSYTDLRSLGHPSSPHIWPLSITLSMVLIGFQR